MADDLARGEDRRRELGAIDDHVEPLLEQADQVLAGVALHAVGGLVGRLELLLGDVAVVALELLLGAQLQAEVAHLALAALAVLAGAVGAAVHRGLAGGPRCSRPCGGRVCAWRSCASTCVVLQFAVAAPVAALQPGLAPHGPCCHARPPLHRGAGPIAKGAPIPARPRKSTPDRPRSARRAAGDRLAAGRRHASLTRCVRVDLRLRSRQIRVRRVATGRSSRCGRSCVACRGRRRPASSLRRRIVSAGSAASLAELRAARPRQGRSLRRMPSSSATAPAMRIMLSLVCIGLP